MKKAIEQNVANKYAREINKGGKELAAYFNDLPEELYSVTVYNHPFVWTVKDLLGHIVTAEEQLFLLFRLVGVGKAGLEVEFDIEKENQEKVEEVRIVSTEELIKRLIAIRQKIVKLINSFSEEQFTNAGNHPFLGETKLENMVKLINIHTKLHIRDIKRGLSKKG